MKYSELAEVYEKLESTQSKLEKTKILADFFKEIKEKDLEKTIFLAAERVFPSYSDKEMGIAAKLMIKSIARATGVGEKDVKKKFKETGDLGLTASECVKERKQQTLMKKTLTVDKVFENLREITKTGGEKSQEKKMNLIAELFASAEPKEAIYVTRTILEELRVGVAEGLIRDAIVEAFLEPEDIKEKKKLRKVVDYAWNIRSDFSEVAKIAKKEGVKGLKDVKIKFGQPIQLMLGVKAEGMEEVFEKHGRVAIEYKYDGMRAEIMKEGDKIWIFTRRLEDVTKQFPDLVKLCKKALKPKECIVEGEVLAIDPETGYPRPFQKLSQRIQRKYKIKEMAEKIPIQINVFDITYKNGKKLFKKKFKERRKILEDSIEESEKFKLAKQIVTGKIKKAEKFYHKALDANQEGVFFKVLDSRYKFGRHVDGWYKIKPIMESLDLVITSATWGEGKRSEWLSSYELSCRDPDTGKLLSCGRMATGLTEEQFQQMTDKLKPLIIGKGGGKKVKIKPKIVVEVAYQEIQKSPNYNSGYALRFPRLVRVRTDKSPEECDTKERVEKLYEKQGN